MKLQLVSGNTARSAVKFLSCMNALQPWGAERSKSLLALTSHAASNRRTSRHRPDLERGCCGSDGRPHWSGKGFSQHWRQRRLPGKRPRIHVNHSVHASGRNCGSGGDDRWCPRSGAPAGSRGPTVAVVPPLPACPPRCAFRLRHVNCLVQTRVVLGTMGWCRRFA